MASNKLRGSSWFIELIFYFVQNLCFEVVYLKLLPPLANGNMMKTLWGLACLCKTNHKPPALCLSRKSNRTPFSCNFSVFTCPLKMCAHFLSS